MKDEIDKRWHDLGEFIREQRNVGQMSLRKLSELAGISNPYLSPIERGLRKPSAEILQAIALALQISSENLYVRAGFLEERDTEEDLVGDILRDRTISEGQKQALVEIYRLIGRDAMTRAYGAISQLNTAAGEPLSLAGKQAFIDHAPPHVRAQVTELVERIVF